MINLLGRIFGAVMNLVYSLFKLRKTKNQIAFISRQSEEPSLDFQYLINEIRTGYPQYEVVVLCKMIPASLGGRVKYLAEIFRQMNALSRSKVVVLDGYCILASVLNHKKDLHIIQIWHALGAFKKFGKSILDKAGGKSSATASAFKMHRNYELVAASGDKCVPHFAEAFGQPEDKFIPIGIPRMDYLTDEAKDREVKGRIFAVYPQLDNGKKTILYVPTFRDNREDIEALHLATQVLVNSIDYSSYNLVVKHHVVDTNKEEIYVDSPQNVTVGEQFAGMDFMCVADYVVTDYSSVIYEAVLKDLPIYLYCFDSERYIDERGFYIDFWNDIPAVYGKTGEEIVNAISSGTTADMSKIDAFKQDYVNKKFDSITSVYGEIIDMLMHDSYDNRYNFKA